MVVTLGQQYYVGAFFFGTVHLLMAITKLRSDAFVQATGPYLTVEVLVVVRAGVIKLLEYPPDRQGDNWLLSKLFTEKRENFVNLHVTWAKFCC